MTSGFAGFSFTERLSVDTFGETWAAIGPDGQRARVRRVDPGLSGHRAFMTSLLASGERLAGIQHPNVVATLAVGRDPEGGLIVVHEELEAPVSLAAVLADARRSGVHASPALALYIGRQVVRALARAHRAQIVHGGVHPRSVLIDARGQVRLADFAVARALAAAAAEDDSLLRGLLGYVAPELALGDAPDARADVFAAGALLHELYTGAPPPGLIDEPPALVDACERALHTDPETRFPDASELMLALDIAASQLGADPGPEEVAQFVAESHGGSNRSLEAETEDVLADLIGDLGHADAAPRDHTPLPAPMPLGPDETRPSSSWPALRSAVREADDEASGAARLALPLPPNPDSSVSLRADLNGSAASRRATELEPVPARRPSAPLRVQTSDVISERGATPVPVATPAPVITRAVTSPRLAAAPAGDLSLRPKGSRTLWLVTVASVAIVGVLVWKSGVLDPGARTDSARLELDQAQAAARAAEVGRTRYADVVIDSNLPAAAVWMSLGKTPLDSLPLSTASIYELRVEQDGFRSADVVVTPGRWTGAGEAMSAAVKVALDPAPLGWTAPAAPPEAPAAETTAKAGRGRIHVDSDPSGAQVWLLVGFTPAVRVANLAADRQHEFKVMLDGHAPALAQVAVTDFLDPTGQTRAEVAKGVVLRPRPKDRK